MSRLIVALCVVGCLYAVQAKPHIGKLGGEIERETKDFKFVSTDDLLNSAYDKLTTLFNTLTKDDREALRDCLVRFIRFTHSRLYDRIFFIDYEQDLHDLRVKVDGMTPEKLVNCTRIMHLEVFDYDLLSETELEKTRAIFIKFLNDPKPDINYYINHSWCTLYDGYKTYKMLAESVNIDETSPSEALDQVIRKLYILRDKVWVTKKAEVTNMVEGIIKRADEELIKCGGVKKNENMLEHYWYESPYEKLVSKVKARYEDLFECFYKSNPWEVAMVTEFLKNIDLRIFKYSDLGVKV